MDTPEGASVTPSEDQQRLLQEELAESPQHRENLDIDIEVGFKPHPFVWASVIRRVYLIQDSTAPLLAHEEAVDQDTEEEEADQKEKEEAAMHGSTYNSKPQVLYWDRTCFGFCGGPIFTKPRSFILLLLPNSI